MKSKQIGMLMGGQNAEHEVSMKTGAALAKALRSRGYRVTEIQVGPDLPGVLMQENIQLAFVALHGRWGEDGCVQGLLEVMRIPYTGSGVLASALSMNKVFAKNLFRQIGLPLAPDLVVSSAEAVNLDSKQLPFDLPVVVKPSREGSSVGVSIVRDPSDLDKALRQACRYAGDVLIERYVKGREIQVAVLDDQALGTIEVVPAGEFYDYRAKYHSQGKTKYLTPARLSDQETKRVMELGRQAHEALGCKGISRVDTVFSEQGQFYILELNAVPGMTENSLVPKIALSAGISFEELAERLLLGACLKA